MFCRRPQRTLQQSAVKLLCARIHKSVGGGGQKCQCGPVAAAAAAADRSTNTQTLSYSHPVSIPSQ